MMEKKMFYSAPPTIFEHAQWLRNHTTKHEEILWQHLRKKQILGVRIKRQHPIGPYIADFYCHAAKLVIEVDGVGHSNQNKKLSDDERTFNLELNGLKIIRFSNDQITNELADVIRVITANVQQGLNSHN